MSSGAPTVTITEIPPSVQGTPVLPSGVFGFVGVAERGPLNEATLVTSFGEYQRLFGGYVAGHDLAQAVACFFREGGASCYVVRVAHVTDVTDPTTVTADTASATLTAVGAAGVVTVVGADYPLDLEPGDAINLNVNGLSRNVTFSATAAVTHADGLGPFDLADGQTLTFQIDGGAVQTIVFDTADVVDIDAVTVAEVADVINRELRGGRAYLSAGKVYVESDTRGTDSTIAAVGGTAAAAMSWTASTAGTGSVPNIDAVTRDDFIAATSAMYTGHVTVNAGDALSLSTITTGVGATIEVINTTDAGFDLDVGTVTGTASTSVNVLTVSGKTPGAFGNALTAAVSAATNGEAARFNLTVRRNGVVVETFANLSMVSTDARFAETIVNRDDASGSRFIAVDVLVATRPTNQTGTLSGGDSGLTGLVAADYLGGSGDDGATGLRALDIIGDLSVVAIPGQTGSSVQNGLLAYCETTRGGLAFAILDPPANATASGIITHVETTNGLLEASEFGAMYWPRVKIANPDKAVFGSDDTIAVYPSGLVAGVYARTDGARLGGVYDSPAGTERGRLLSALGFEGDDCRNAAKLDLVYPKRINPLTVSRTGLRIIDGGRTLKSTGNFPNVPERRGVIFIERSVKAALEPFKHELNDAELRARVFKTLTAFLVTQMQRRAFATTTPATAFYIRCDETNNPASLRVQGILAVDIGLATNKPAEFIVVTVTQDTRALEAELASV